MCDGRKWKDKTLEAIPAKELEELRAVLGREAPGLPDLLGRFLRGVDAAIEGKSSGRDQDGVRAVGKPQNDATRIPDDVKTKPMNEKDRDGQHVHAQNAPGLKHRLAISDGKMTFANNTPHDDDKTLSEINMQSGADIGPGGHSHRLTGGAKETRPTNVAVYWIIKFRTGPASGPTPPGGR